MSLSHILVGLAVALVVFFIANVSTGEKKVDRKIAALYSVEDGAFVRSMGNLLGPQLTEGNRTQELLNGDAIFPAMLEAIRGAQKSITFETYIYWSGEIGKEFSQALSDRARAGVRVHVLLDWVGTSKMNDSELDEMREAGVLVEKYHPIRFFNLGRLNNRTHRKLLVIDGSIGFTGGVGIADKWLGDAKDPDHWRDTHFRVEGPAVAQMQGAFMDNWIKSRGEVLHGNDYFPPLAKAGDQIAQVFKSSANEGSESARLMYLMSITCAARSVRIANSYFVPDDLSVETLVAAKKRGARVQIIVPGEHIDAEVTRKASKSRWGPLLEAGAEIYEFQPTMYHCKVMIIDEIWVSVGSTNFDSRSFRLNDEANLNVLDAGFAKRQVEIFEADLLRSRPFTHAQWKRRPFSEKVMEHMAGLLRSQL
ncbi:MAG: phospholipase D-like domain-containing protein [Thermoanaerobaculia bacterium]